MTKGITVYCASSDHIAPEYFNAAVALGKGIAHRGLPVIDGGGMMGLMGAINDTVLSAGGTAIGVIPQFMVDAHRNHKELTETIITSSMHERKKIMADMAIGVIALPGGVGTLEEVTEIMAWCKLGLFNRPVVLLNINGYWDSIIEWLELSVKEGFTSQKNKVWLVADTPEQALELACSGPKNYHPVF